MAKPILTEAQRAQLESERAKAEATKALFDAQGPALDARKAELQLVDDGYKALMNWYNIDIIGKYDIERQSLNGIYIPNPIVEADVIQPAKLDGTHRTTPAMPITDIVRIPEFDGGNTAINVINESQHLINQAFTENLIQNGTTGTAPTITLTTLTASSLDASSTTLDISDTVGPVLFSVGNVFVVYDNGTNAALVEVTGVTINAGGNPPYNITLNINVLVAPTNPIIPSSKLKAPYIGFTNAERTIKTATDINLQPLLDNLVIKLEADINLRKSRLLEQFSALTTNDDPDGVADITTAITNVNNSISFLEDYLLTLDISDSGLSNLSSNRATRTTEISIRITQISNAYTNQTENYYNRRYSLANDRGNTSRGSLRLYYNADATKDTGAQFGVNAQAAIDSLNALLA